MVLETTDSVPAPVTDTAPAFGDPTPTPEVESEPTPQQEPATGEETQAPPTRTWDTIKGEIDGDDALRSEYEAHLDEVRHNSRREGRQEVQERFSQAVKRNEQYLSVTAQGLQQMDRTLRKLMSDGEVSDAAVQRIFEDNPQVWQAWTGYGLQKGIYEGVKSFLGQFPESDRNSIEPFIKRVDDVETGIDTAKNFTADLVDAIAQGRIDRATKPLTAKIAKLEAELESVKAGRRDGEGPASPAAAPSGKKLYSQMSREERVALTPEQRDAAAAYEASLT